jgi:hypothetical protein
MSLSKPSRETPIPDGPTPLRTSAFISLSALSLLCAFASLRLCVKIKAPIEPQGEAARGELLTTSSPAHFDPSRKLAGGI